MQRWLTNDEGNMPQSHVLLVRVREGRTDVRRVDELALITQLDRSGFGSSQVLTVESLRVGGLLVRTGPTPDALHEYKPARAFGEDVIAKPLSRFVPVERLACGARVAPNRAVGLVHQVDAENVASRAQRRRKLRPRLHELRLGVGDRAPQADFRGSIGGRL